MADHDESGGNSALPAAYETWQVAPAQPASAAEVDPASSKTSKKRRWLTVFLVLVPLGLVAGFGLLVSAVLVQARDDERNPAEAIIVLGAAQFNGTPSQVLQARLDQTLDLYQQGYAPLIVVTGGNQPGDVYTEAEASANFLVDQGVPAEAILVESTSSNTQENLEGAAALLTPRGVSDVLIVSDGFHILRGKLIAKDQGLDPAGVPASDSPIEHGSSTELNYAIREAAAIVAYYWQKVF